MRCLNSPPVLNSVETKTLESIDGEARHVLVVNAGDGRLARAIREKLGVGATVSVVSIFPAMRSYVEDFAGAGKEAWDYEWYAQKVASHGAFDSIVFYQLHEFWRGQLFQLQRIVHLAKPGASVTVSFLNAQALKLVGRFLPPLDLGFSTLADPLRVGATVDFASFCDWVAKIGGRISELWALLDTRAEKFCKEQPATPVQWESRGLKVTVGTVADAFLWGGTVVSIAFHTPGGPPVATTPKLSYSTFNPVLLQALTLPYPDYQATEGTLAAAQLEMAAARDAKAETSPLLRFFLEQVKAADDRPKRILVVGAGWGRDLVALEEHFAGATLTGFDHRSDLAALGRNVLSGANCAVTTGELGKPLPFADGAFELTLSLGYMSMLYEPAAREVAKELRRVTRGTIYHLEDGRGPEHGLHLKAHSLPAIYQELNAAPTVQPVLAQGQPTGMYLLKVASA